MGLVDEHCHPKHLYTLISFDVYLHLYVDLATKFMPFGLCG